MPLDQPLNVYSRPRRLLREQGVALVIRRTAAAEHTTPHLHNYSLPSALVRQTHKTSLSIPMGNYTFHSLFLVDLLLASSAAQCMPNGAGADLRPTTSVSRSFGNPKGVLPSAAISKMLANFALRKADAIGSDFASTLYSIVPVVNAPNGESTEIGSETVILSAISNKERYIHWANCSASGSFVGKTVSSGTDPFLPFSSSAISLNCSASGIRPAICRLSLMISDCCALLIHSSIINNEIVQHDSTTTAMITAHFAACCTRFEYFSASNIIAPPTTIPASTLNDSKIRWGQNGSAVPDRIEVRYVGIATALSWLFAAGAGLYRLD